MAGPVATIRQLRLVIQSLQDIASSGQPRLPGRPKTGTDGRVRVPVFPAQGMFDCDHVPGIQGRCLDEAGHCEESLRVVSRRVPGRWKSGQPADLPRAGSGQCLVDSHDRRLHQALPGGADRPAQDEPGQRVAGTDFRAGLQAADRRRLPADHLRRSRCRRGGRRTRAGRRGAHHRFDPFARRDRVGPARVRSAIGGSATTIPCSASRSPANWATSRPGSSCPGNTPNEQLDFQAENVATSITNNCSFNCIATKVIVTSANWPDRDRFLDKVARVLGRIAPRKAYYPGAAERFRRFSGQSVPAGGDTLPWTLLRSISPKESPLFFQRGIVRVRQRRDAARRRFRHGLSRPGRRFCQQRVVGNAGGVDHAAGRFPQGSDPRTGVAIGPWSSSGSARSRSTSGRGSLLP